MMERTIGQPSRLILDTMDNPPPSLVSYNCLNGPCAGTPVEAPSDATPGTGCAIPWKTPNGEQRYAVYLLVEHNGHYGLMFIQSYQRPEYAQAKVNRLTAICAASVS